MKIIVFGAGLVGRPMALDLAKDEDFEIVSVDIDEQALARIPKTDRIKTIRADLSDAGTVKKIVKDGDIVVSAVPGFMGYRTLEAVLEAGKNVVDIAFFPEDPFKLDALARKKNCIAIVDCGVAPGMSNILAAHAMRRLDKTRSILTYVGGLPSRRIWPYEYKAGFSPIDVIEEYLRPARYVENGRMIVRPALSDPEYLDFPEIGTLEAFNTDGLRSMAATLEVPNMKEKTLRYPGHIEKMRILRETGFFGAGEIDVRGVKVRPIDLTAKLLFPMWKLGEGEEDITVMKVIVEGMARNRNVRIVYDLFDRADKKTGVHSMARTTGYTATMAVRMIARGLFERRGISAPEHVGMIPICVAFMLKGLNNRGVVYRESSQAIE